MVKNLILPYTERDELFNSALSKYLGEEEKQLEDIFFRMARAVTDPSAEFRIHGRTEDDLLWAFENGLMPQGSILYALGNTSSYCSVSNCYYIDIEEDSIEGIMDAAKRAAIIYKYRGGVGIDLGNLRPKGAKVSNSARTSSGAASFMELYSKVTGVIGQFGRRGALMLTMPIDHPDVIEFIEKKQTPGIITDANVSVRITDEFMNAVIDDKKFNLKFKGKIYKTVDAKYLWNKIIKCAWKSAEPGVLFWDRILEFGAASYYKQLRPKGTNPCSEIPMGHGDACTLASIYCPLFVIDPYNTELNPNKNFDWKRFERVIRTGIRFLDVLKDIDNTPFDFQKQIAQLGRRIGLGMHGIGDTLIRLGLIYGTQEAINFTAKLAQVLKDISYNESAELAKELGPFPLYNYKMEQEFCPWIDYGLSDETKHKLKVFGRRNVQLNTIAPTGTISIINNNCTSGIEPVFRLSYLRTTRLGGSDTEHLVHHPEVRKYCEKFGKNLNNLPPFFIESSQIKPLDRVKMQAAVAQFIDHSISSTVNLPNNCSLEDVETVILEAFKNRCKGITVYRDGSREGILNEVNGKSKIGHVRLRPEILQALSHRIVCEGNQWYITVTYSDGLPFDVMATSNYIKSSIVEDGVFILKSVCKKYKLLTEYNEQLSKTQNTFDAFMRIISLLLRASIPVEEIFADIDSIVGSIPWHIKNLLKPIDQLGCKNGTCG